MMTFVAWGALLILQNAAFTLVSRARNSKSVMFHALASLPSNGIWIASQFILIASISEALKTGTLLDKVVIGVFYTACTMVGSVGMHVVSMRYFETRVKA